MTEWEKEIRREICDACTNAGAGCDDRYIFCDYGLDFVTLIKQKIKEAVSETVCCPVSHNHPYNKTEVLSKRGIK